MLKIITKKFGLDLEIIFRL